MDINEMNINKIKGKEVIDIYNKTKEFINFLEKEIKEVEEKNA